MPNKILSLDLGLDAICPYLSMQEDKDAVFKTDIVSFDDLNITNYSDSPAAVSALLFNMIIKDFVEDPSLSLYALEGKFTSRFFSIVDPEDKENLAIAARTYIKIIDAHKILHSVFSGYSHIASNIDFYCTIGIRPRNAYRTCIDAFLVRPGATDLFLILKKEYGSENSLAYNPKLLAAIDYCAEANINVSNIYILAYGWNFSTSAAKIQLQKISITDYLRSTANKFKSMTFMNCANLAHCQSCHYRDTCAKSNIHNRNYV